MIDLNPIRALRLALAAGLLVSFGALGNFGGLGLLAAPVSGASHPAADGVELRALWVPRSVLATPDSIATMVRAAQASGFNAIFVQVRGRGEAFYRSAIEPRATELQRQPESFDPLALTLSLGHAAGLRVHAWVNVNLVASSATLPRESRHVALRHPEWLMVPKALGQALAETSPRAPGYLGALSRWTRGESDRVEGLYVSPVTSRARAYTTGVVRELVAQYPVDGLHLDYVRYPQEDFDYSPAALSEFRTALGSSLTAQARARLEAAAALDPTVWASQHSREWAAFLRDRLTLLVSAVQADARQARPGIQISAAVVPSAEDARSRKMQDWPVWARAGYFDALSPMIYTTSTPEFAATLEALPALMGGTPFWAGIGAYRLPASRTAEHVRLVRQSQASGFVLFSYEKLAESGTAASALAALAPVVLDTAAAGGGRPQG